MLRALKLMVNAAVVAAIFSLCTGRLSLAQTGAKDGEWRSYGGDLGNTRYSPLKQIDASNFDKLQVAWRFSGANSGRGRNTTWKRRR